MASKLYNYFYKITNKINGHFYYGVHSTNKLNDDYMGSGTRLHLAYKKYGKENFEKTIIKFFDNIDDAYQMEKDIVTTDLVIDPNCYNLVTGGRSYNISDYIICENKINKEKKRFYKNDPNWNKNIFIPLNKGKIRAYNSELKCERVNVNDPRLLSGELVVWSKNRCSVKDKDGNTLSVFKDDPRLLSGELVHHSTGLCTYYDKNGNKYRLDINDPKIDELNLIHPNNNKTIYKDSNGNLYSLHIDDPKIKELDLHGINFNSEHAKNVMKQTTTGKAVVKDKNGNILWVNKDDPRLLSGELVHHSKNKILIHKNNKSKMVELNLLDNYLSDGWERGSKHLSNCKGKIFINKNGKTIRIIPEELSNYLKDGWIKGRAKFESKGNKGKIYINNGLHNKMIYESELHLYPDWKLGKISIK